MRERAPTLWRIGDVRFRPDTGELTRPGDGPDAEPVRLPPQPSRLLDLLARRSGELVTREEIRELLWGETHVDLDQSLSFCLRQVRTALGDSATGPAWIETLPRRGYRLLKEATRLEEPATPAAGGAAARARSRLVIGASLLAAVVASLLWWAPRAGAPAQERVRLAIMPFELAPAGTSRPAGLAAVSESLVVDFASRDGLEVVGPRTTIAYGASPFPDLARLAAELDIDYVLNARLLAARPAPELIVELIRLPDGAHVWVERFAAPWVPEAVTARVCAGAGAALESASP